MTMIHPTIETLRRLRLTGMAKALEEQQSLSDCDRLSFDERLAMLVDREAVERDNVALAQRLRLARLRQAACLEDIDYRTPRGLDRSLSTPATPARAPAREEMAIDWRGISTLIPYARNARTHSDAQIAEISGSIREFGFTNPVLIATLRAESS